MSEARSPREERSKDIILILLRLAASSMFLGRGILYLSKASPLSAFFWHQDWLEKPLLNWFGIGWEQYAATSEPMINGVQYSMGMLFLVAAFTCWIVKPGKRSPSLWVILTATLCLLPYWLLSWVDKAFQFPMFLEHFLQWGTPVLLVFYRGLDTKKWFAMAWIMVSCTFIGHGQYAIGLGVPHSNEYVNMCIRLLGVDEQGALQFLKVVGWIDLLLPALFLTPYLRIPALAYATFWGLGTALARILSHYTPAEDYYGLHPWTAEAIVRLTHGLIPLAMLLLLRQLHRQSMTEQKSSPQKTKSQA